MTALTDTEKAILDLERLRWKFAGAKESAIHERLGWSPTRYYKRLNALLDDPAALAEDPMTVRRLLKLRERRRAARRGA